MVERVKRIDADLELYLLGDSEVFPKRQVGVPKSRGTDGPAAEIAGANRQTRCRTDGHLNECRLIQILQRLCVIGVYRAAENIRTAYVFASCLSNDDGLSSGGGKDTGELPSTEDLPERRICEFSQHRKLIYPVRGEVVCHIAIGKTPFRTQVEKILRADIGVVLIICANISAIGRHLLGPCVADCKSEVMGKAFAQGSLP